MPQFLKRLLLAVFSMLSLALPAQNSAYHDYIHRYKDMAMEQMFKYGIPASITLAQGLLESGAGRSTLATRANNHFGIKVSGSWTGPYVLRDDDAPNEKFRSYRNARESYEDHSLFLVRGRRYAGLFKLKVSDYKGWARGLKKAGYATNPNYANLLIGIIETYDLHRFDKYSKKAWRKIVKNGGDETLFYNRQVFKCNKNYYIIACEGDTYESIGEWADVSARKLRKYNEVPKKSVLQPGEIVFLEKKRSKAARALKRHVHTVKPGESMHSIAQTYAVRMKTLYELNGLPEGSPVEVGQQLRIR